MDNENQWCFAWFAARQAGEGADKAALLRGAKWPKHSVITISFLDGDPAVQQKVRDVAMGWTAPGNANLTFDFRDKQPTNIRISFKFPGSWSVIGTTCKQITDQTRPTMNFGWLTKNSTDEEIHRVVLHEFGHALGLIHEHQNPSGGIQWNRDQVIKDLSGPPNNWSLEDIEFNMFKPFDKSETNFTKLDAQSIMMYPLPAKWTTNGFSVGLNTGLSTIDKKFIHNQYK